MSHQQWRLAVGALLGIGLLWLAARGVAWGDVAAALGSARWSPIATGVGGVLLATMLRAWCWRRLLIDTRVPMGFVQVWKILVVGQFVNICLPARAGDVARVYLMGETAQISKAGVATSLVLEKIFDATTLLLLLGFASLQLELPEGLEGPGRGVALAMVLLLLAVIALAWNRRWLVRRLERCADGDSRHVAWLARHGTTVVESLGVIRSWQGLVLMQTGYLGTWLALAGVNYAVLRALQIDTPFAAALVVLIVLQLGTAVPSTPGKIGVFQYLAVLALAPFGVPREPALTYGVLLHVVGFGPLVVLGGFWSWRRVAAGK